MKLLLVRHAEPDYEHDSLTEKGRREAAFLSRRLAQIPAKACYVSPLGRAKATAEPTLNIMGTAAIECPWLREFHAPIWRPDVSEHKMITWDWLPQDWMADERFFRYDQWHQVQTMLDGGVKAEYDWVTGELDALLERHGYRRDGRCYRAFAPNSDVLILFCHFGVTCVLLSHLLNVSPMILWHGFCSAPSSVTTVVTEERREGIASFRILEFGDISHLYENGETPSFMARFRECYTNDWERMD